MIRGAWWQIGHVTRGPAVTAGPRDTADRQRPELLGRETPVGKVAAHVLGQVLLDVELVI
jgi:hypothetical protein